MLFQSIPIAPSNAQPGTAGTVQPSGPAAPATSTSFLGGLGPIVFMIPLGIFLWYSSRRNNKKEEDARKAMKKGDRVLSQSGLVGELTELEGRFAKVKLAPGITVQMLASTLGPLETPVATPAAATAAASPSVSPSGAKADTK